MYKGWNSSYIRRRKLPQMMEFVSLEIGCNNATGAILLLKMIGRSKEVELSKWLEKTRMDNFFYPIDKQT